MSTVTTYDEMLDDLVEKMDEALELARQCMDKNIWGYDEYKEGKDFEQFVAIREARNKLMRG